MAAEIVLRSEAAGSLPTGAYVLGNCLLRHCTFLLLHIPFSLSNCRLDQSDQYFLRNNTVISPDDVDAARLTLHANRSIQSLAS